MSLKLEALSKQERAMVRACVAEKRRGLDHFISNTEIIDAVDKFGLATPRAVACAEREMSKIDAVAGGEALNVPFALYEDQVAIQRLRAQIKKKGGVKRVAERMEMTTRHLLRVVSSAEKKQSKSNGLKKLLKFLGKSDDWLEGVHPGPQRSLRLVKGEIFCLEREIAVDQTFARPGRLNADFYAKLVQHKTKQLEALRDPAFIAACEKFDEAQPSED